MPVSDQATSQHPSNETALPRAADARAGRLHDNPSTFASDSGIDAFRVAKETFEERGI